MGDLYAECLVKKEKTGKDTLLKAGSITGAVCRPGVASVYGICGGGRGSGVLFCLSQDRHRI